jgi:hypothetical protein
MIHAVDDTILKLHTAESGEVWYADGNKSPRNSSNQLDDFISSQIWRGKPRDVRVLGLAVNAPLITQLYQLQLRGRLGRLELAGPLVCETRKERRDPEVALYRMRQCLLGPALGGWHLFNDRDYPTYAMAAHLQANHGEFDLTVGHLLSLHPAYHDLMFIPHLNRESLAQLLVSILDPRWFVSPHRPERLATLETYLGLNPRVQRVVTVDRQAAKQLADSHIHRCAVVLDAWKNNRPSEAERIHDPRQFLWRVWHATNTSDVLSDLRASQRFLAYLRHTWLNRLCLDRHDPLFDPARLLTLTEVAAYKLHDKRRVRP